MNRAILIPLVIILSACAPAKIWVKPDTSEQRFSQDKSQCRFEAVKAANQRDSSYRSSFGQELDLANRQGEVYSACMEARGYSQKPQ